MVMIEIPFEDLEKIVRKLSPDQKRILRGWLESDKTNDEISPRHRIPNLHAGGWVSEDFDAPLNDQEPTTKNQ